MEEQTDYQNKKNEFTFETKEIFVLTNDNDNCAFAYGDESYTISRPCLAFIDLASNKLYDRNCFLKWLQVKDPTLENNLDFPYNFKKGTSYKVKVREHLDNQSYEEQKKYPLSFEMVEILEEKIYNKDLENILNTYRTPITLEDKNIGSFILNKDYECFDSDHIYWGNKEISVTLDVQNDNESTWEQALQYLKELIKQQPKFDLDFKTFASQELTDLANEWSEDPSIKITNSDFINRISLSSLNLSFDGDLTLYFDDDDIFYGHTIMIQGNINNGLEYAQIAG